MTELFVVGAVKFVLFSSDLLGEMVGEVGG